jgi:cobalt-zinc-cadmium efflux system outer membrane protein
MASRTATCAICATAVGLIAGCSSPFDRPHDTTRSLGRTLPQGVERVPPSAYRDTSGGGGRVMPTLSADAPPDEYIRYALYNSPEVEAAYQRWRAAAERLPQVRALPDPRVNLGYSFMDDEATIGVMQSFPWPGTLGKREAAAGSAALAVWHEFQAARLMASERVLLALHELAYIDAAIRNTTENLDLIRSFEELVRARYRVGVGTHPELIRAQVEVGQAEDRLAELHALRPVYVADLNASLNRPPSASIGRVGLAPAVRVAADASSLVAIARRMHPSLLALDGRAEEQRLSADAARRSGLPEFSFGIDYMFYEGHVIQRSGAGDPVMVTMGMSVPLWREKYDAGVREALSRRLAVSHDREGETNRIAAAIHRAWFEHTDADRRVRLYERTLTPKAEESLRASLAGFRAGETGFLDLLDTERTLLEFSIAAERARADRGKALARLNTLVGEPVPTEPADQISKRQDEVQP